MAKLIENWRPVTGTRRGPLRCSRFALRGVRLSGSSRVSVSLTRAGRLLSDGPVVSLEAAGSVRSGEVS
jgi:hypothetical protein